MASRGRRSVRSWSGPAMRVANVRYVAIVRRLGSGAIVPISSGCIGFATVSSIVHPNAGDAEAPWAGHRRHTPKFRGPTSSTLRLTDLRCSESSTHIPQEGLRTYFYHDPLGPPRHADPR